MQRRGVACHCNLVSNDLDDYCPDGVFTLEPLKVCFCSLYLLSKMIPQSVHSFPPPLPYLLEWRWRYTAACLSALHASAACHTCEHNVEEERRQIKYQTIARIVTHAGELAYFDSFFNSLTVTALKFLNLPVECTRG